MRSTVRERAATIVVAGLVATTLLGAVIHGRSVDLRAARAAGRAAASQAVDAAHVAATQRATTTPIHHLVVLFQENVPFDRYFGVYPRALNPPGEPPFVAWPGTPPVNGLTPALLAHNPNIAAPYRLSRTQPNVCGSNHGYTAEQAAVNHGRADRFVQETGNHGPHCDGTMGMGYFDGNTVTAMWNYAQHFAMSDNSFGTTYGPSHIGLLNLVSGQTHGVHTTAPTDAVVDATMIANVEPAFDDCPRASLSASMSGRNIGNLLNARHVTWGFFSAGFRPTARRPDGTAVCDAIGVSRYGARGKLYDSGNEGFQYYASTSNRHHLPPTSIPAIGHTDQANHQYDLADFWAAADHGNLPAVSFLKAGGFEQGGGGVSDPLDEQSFVVTLLNRLQRLPTWADTAVIIMYDDSDGAYDHVVPPLVNGSRTQADVLTAPGRCGGHGVAILGGYQGRCGHGPRLPFLVVSPWSRVNHVDHTLTDQTSVIRFIEDNWRLGRIGGGSFDALSGPITGMFDFRHPTAAPLLLDSQTGLPVPWGPTHRARSHPR
jgi:phospholipase C